MALRYQYLFKYCSLVHAHAPQPSSHMVRLLCRDSLIAQPESQTLAFTTSTSSVALRCREAVLCIDTARESHTVMERHSKNHHCKVDGRL